ncbi:hypothetical protein GSI_12624 [Ganoderma sinense ZZ0214-1]|uniref:Uncharacterized protein n=1 Tax=Ganoderma sinense ZZ0214-1 TaxID=1077348 RepID=A0A2G8RTS4_9APHY|nr:hypothetical protein GSI_12624 [Ganoderma sinense ZZ0214-1]
MTRNAYTVAVACTFVDDTQYLASSTGDGWRGHNAQSWQTTPSVSSHILKRFVASSTHPTTHQRPSPIDLETIDAHFQRVLARFKRVEERRASRSTSPGCWYSPTTPSPWATSPVAAPTDSRALWLLNNCQNTRQTELRMIEARVRKELDARLGSWGVSAVAAQYRQSQPIDWPAPPPPPRPYSPSPTPWMEPSSLGTTSRAAVTETERRVEGIPIRISRMARRRIDQRRSSCTPVPHTATTDALLPTSYGPPPSQPYPEGAGTASAQVIYQTNAVPREMPTEALQLSHWCPSWSPMLDVPHNTARQYRGEDRLHSTVDHTVSCSDGGATYGGRSPVSRGLHTPEEVMPWAERRVNYGFERGRRAGPAESEGGLIPAGPNGQRFMGGYEETVEVEKRPESGHSRFEIMVTHFYVKSQRYSATVSTPKSVLGATGK